MNTLNSHSPSLIWLENTFLKASVLPGVGAKILDLIDCRTGRNFLWHNPRILPQSYPIEANFDNYWCGEWDDAFPTCETCVHNGEQYPNLGELRSIAWAIDSVNSSGPEPRVSMHSFGPISPVRAEKTIRLTENSIEISFRIENVSTFPLDFIWGTHPAYAVEPGCKIHIPAATGIVGQSNNRLLGSPGQTYAWPILDPAGNGTDMSLVPSLEASYAGHYATDLTAGWYAIEHPENQGGLLFEFPLEICPVLWLWLSYGGWRGYYLAVIEPWTGYPVTLSDAVARNAHCVLRPGTPFQCTVRATLWTSPVTLEELLTERKYRR